ncbi:hypothetical protein ALC60_14507 [Trachymyrmex zeteki]|uniref:Uncharacterized protein n=1 Tax=Mycetomoellerius zeteki TaxID=64791 RepID=A0A151WF30_9HYME|nr:hypothetical protein ALC60_14507 [Trachymyrmex zeteki]
MGDVSQQQRIIIRNAQQAEPKNPSFVSKRDRIAQQYYIVRNWKPWSDVYITPLHYSLLKSYIFIVNKLLLLEIPCPLCMEFKSALMQTCSGVFLPLMLVPLANFSVAAGSGVYSTPHITDIRGIFRSVFTLYQPMFPKIAMIFTFHMLLAGFITYSEIKSYLRMLDIQYLIIEEKEQKNIL